jgi:hypothetical protein
MLQPMMAQRGQSFTDSEALVSPATSKSVCLKFGSLLGCQMRDVPPSFHDSTII